MSISRVLPDDSTLRMGNLVATGWNLTVNDTRISTPEYSLVIPEAYTEFSLISLLAQKRVKNIEINRPRLTLDMVHFAKGNGDDAVVDWDTLLADATAVNQLDIIDGKVLLSHPQGDVSMGVEAMASAEEDGLSLALACSHPQGVVDVGAAYELATRSGEVKVTGKLYNAPFWQTTLNNFIGLTLPERLGLDFSELRFQSLFTYTLEGIKATGIIAEILEPVITHNDLTATFQELALAVNMEGNQLESFSVGGPLISLVGGDHNYLSTQQFLANYTVADGLSVEVIDGAVAAPFGFYGKLNLAAHMPTLDGSSKDISLKGRIDEFTNGKLGIKSLRLETDRTQTLPFRLKGEMFPLPLPVIGRFKYDETGNWVGYAGIPRTRVEETHLFNAFLPKVFQQSTISGVLSGKITCSGVTAQYSSSVSLLIQEGNINLPDYQTSLTNLNFSFFGRLLPTLETRRIGTLSFESLQMGDFTITSGELSYEFSGGVIRIREMKGSFLGGRLSVSPMEIDPQSPSVDLELIFEQLELEQIPRLKESFDIGIEGSVSGKLALRWENGELTPMPGHLLLDTGTRARLKYTRRGWLTSNMTEGSSEYISMSIVEQSMGDLWVNALRIDLFSPATPDRPIYIRIEGEPASGKSRFPLILEQPIEASLSDLFNLGALAPSVGNVRFE